MGPWPRDNGVVQIKKFPPLTTGKKMDEVSNLLDSGSSSEVISKISENLKKIPKLLIS